MNGNTALLLLDIVIIGIIAIVIVKLYYRDGTKDKNIENLSQLKEEFFGNRININKKRSNYDLNRSFIDKHQSLAKKNTSDENYNKSSYSTDRTESTGSISDIVVTPDKGVYTVEKVMLKDNYVETIEPIHEEVEDESTGTVAILKEDNEDTAVEEDIPEVKIPLVEKETPKNNNADENVSEEENPENVSEEKTPDNTDFKELFTIDELIKESKRKDNERERKNKGEDLEETKIKESISKNKNIANAINKTPEEVSKPEEELSPVEKINTIKKLLDKSSSTADSENESAEKPAEDKKVEEVQDIETPKLKEENPQEEILKEDVSIYQLKETESEYPEEDFDLDYRKDLEKIKSVFKKSKIINNVKNKITPEMEYENFESNDEFIKNVNSEKGYGDYNEPIIPQHNRRKNHPRPYKSNNRSSGEANTRKVYNMAKNTVGEAKTESSLRTSPSQKSISFILNNEKTTLKLKDEIIYFIGQETYSSKVFDIRGEDIYVRYRGKNKIIKTSDIKKIY